MTLLAVDPGLRNPAWAYFIEGVLMRAQRTKIPASLVKLPVGQRCLEVAKLIRADYFANAPSTWVTELVIEYPQIYTARKSKGDPNDLLPLVGVGMALAGMLDVPVISPTPAQWIGQVAKATTGDPLASPRGARIWGRLSEIERSNVVVSHDSIDAVGIALWRLGRLEKRRVLPGVND